MKLERFRPFIRPLLVVAAVALVVDLFLDWREVSITTPMAGLHVGSSAWSGAWGIAVGMVALGLLVAELPELAKGVVGADATRAGVVAVLGVCTLAFTLAAFGATEVEISGPMSAVQLGNRLWPAYAGVVLASVIAILSVGQFFLAAGPELSPRLRTRHHGAA